jgi:monofunctional glycosyltransferase
LALHAESTSHLRPHVVRPKSRRSTSGSRRRRAARITLASLGVALVAGLLVWFVVIPYPRGLDAGDPGPSSLMEQRIEEGRASGDSLIIRREWVPLADISPNLVRAVVVAEDYRFRQHQGIDWVSLAEEVQWSGDEQFSWTNPSDLRALAEALGHVWANRDEIRGRSTITQQLAKNLFFGTDRSLLRKAMEYVVARRLERRLDKDRILELYLNAAEWGPGVFGAEAAARTYFGRSAASLGLEQAAALAATLPHPLTSNPAHRPGRMAWRRDLILERLRPATGVPTEPLPLPPPRLDLGPDLPDVVVPPIDTGGAGPRDSAGMSPVDTGAVLPPDTTASPGVRSP